MTRGNASGQLPGVLTARSAPRHEPFRTLWRTMPMGASDLVNSTGLIATSIACGLLIVAVAYHGSRTGVPWAEAVFWLGLVVMVAPVAFRFAGSEVSRTEAHGLILLLGLGFYLVKIAHSPYGFTFHDELVHQGTLNSIFESGHLFGPNALLPATPYFPGLEISAAAVMALSDLTGFGTGLAVIGVARLVLLSALFKLFEHASESPRAAGIAVLIYMAQPNFVFFGAQFSYESLALPMAVVALAVIQARDFVNDLLSLRRWTLVWLVVIAALVVTHHLSTYFVVGMLVLSALCHFNVHVLVMGTAARAVGFYAGEITGQELTLEMQTGLRRWRQLWGPTANNNPGPALLAIIGLSLASAWLVYIGTLTVGYLSPVFGGALDALSQFIAGELAPRALFRSASGVDAPILERVIGLGTPLLLLAGLCTGLIVVWRRHRRKTLAMLLVVSALSYFPMMFLRFLPAGWEVGNRASAFLFAGLALGVALAVKDVWRPHQRATHHRVLFVVSVVFVIAGGLIAGWIPRLRLAHPLLVQVGEITLEPQGLVASRWTRTHLGMGNRIVSDISNALLLLAHGRQFPISDSRYAIPDLLAAPRVDASFRSILIGLKARYLLVDHRRVSADNMLGLYFGRTFNGVLSPDELWPPEVTGKFDSQLGVSRLYDSGDIVLYDVGVWTRYAARK